MRTIDLSQLSVPQLKAIRTILTDGSIAEAGAKDVARKLKEDNARLKKINERREIVLDAGLDWDEDYYMSFSDKHFITTIEKLSHAQRQGKLAEATRTVLRIPPIVAPQSRSDIEIIREGLQNRRNGSGES